MARRFPLTTDDFKPFCFQIGINMPISIAVGGFCDLIVTEINSKDFQVNVSFFSGLAFSLSGVIDLFGLHVRSNVQSFAARPQLECIL